MLSHQATAAERSADVDDVAESVIWSAPSPAGAVSATNGQERGHTFDWLTPVLLVTLDILAWVLIYAMIGYVRRDAFFTTPLEFVLVDCVVFAVIVQAIYIIGGYSRNTETRSLTYTTEHILAMVVAAVIAAAVIYSAATFDKGMRPSRGVLLLSFVAFLPVSLLYRRIIHARVASSTAQRAYLVIGSGPLAESFYHVYRTSPTRQRLEFVTTDDAGIGRHIAGPESPVIEGGIEERLAQVDRRYSGIILATSPGELSAGLLDRLVRTQFQHTRVYTLESFYETHWRSVPLHTIDPFWPLQMGFQLARISPYHYLKRLFDMIVAAALLSVLWPVLGALTCLVWLTSGRPAVFRQIRVGREGHPFTAYKFRTMYTPGNGPRRMSVATATSSDGEEDRGQNAQPSTLNPQPSVAEEDDIYTRAEDPRVTKLGRWLRKLRLDELPQLFNVLKGDMSLIGPRAEWIKCAERYEKSIPFYHFRHLVKPGITGWAQVNYPYGESDEDAIEKLKYDLYYIRRYSLKLDAMIFLKTIHTVLFGKGR